MAHITKTNHRWRLFYISKVSRIIERKYFLSSQNISMIPTMRTMMRIGMRLTWKRRKMMRTIRTIKRVIRVRKLEMRKRMMMTRRRMGMLRRLQQTAGLSTMGFQALITVVTGIVSIVATLAIGRTAVRAVDVRTLSVTVAAMSGITRTRVQRRRGHVTIVINVAGRGTGPPLASTGGECCLYFDCHSKLIFFRVSVFYLFFYSIQSCSGKSYRTAAVARIPLIVVLFYFYLSKCIFVLYERYTKLNSVFPSFLTLLIWSVRSTFNFK